MLRSPVGRVFGEGGGIVVRSRGFGGGGVGAGAIGGLVSRVEFLMPYLKYIIIPENQKRFELHYRTLQLEVGSKLHSNAQE